MLSTLPDVVLAVVRAVLPGHVYCQVMCTA
jgi:hypothetical protein